MKLPLLAWTAFMQSDSFKVLDETALPEKITYINVKDYNEASEVIRTMKTRAFGQLLTVMYALIITARKSTYENILGNVKEAAKVLNSSRPTFAFSQYTSLVINFAELSIRQNDVLPSMFVENQIINFLEGIKVLRFKRAELAASLIEDGDSILTHCNTSGELVIMAKFCLLMKKNIKIYAAETRPFFQGRLTAWELSMNKFDVTLVPDNKTAELLATGKINKVVTGSDRVALNGDIINKVGTFQIAIAAKKFNIPFYVFVQDPGNIKRGEDIIIEYRDEKELIYRGGKELYPSYVKAFYPSFDITPNRYISKLITFQKIISPSELPELWKNNN